MPLEPSVTWFSDLDNNQPQDGDYLVEGDNHIRNLKTTIKNQLSALGDVALTVTATELNVFAGAGVSNADAIKLAAINASASEINLLVGKSLASADDVLDNFPSGTIMTFQQTAAPTGWTKEVTHNDKAFRVVTGTAGSGGTKAFTTAFGAGKSTDSFTLLEAHIPAHNHGGGNHTHVDNVTNNTGTGLSGYNRGNSYPYARNAPNSGAIINSYGGSSGHSHGLSNFDLNYVDMILASKN
jgi:hypothetical protein